MKPDLDSIYAELDIDPGCTLAEFKRAYRRRIAELHPDRDGSRRPEDQALLRDLILVYEAVTRFHRRYGRMPGGTAPRPGGVAGSRFFVFRSPIQEEVQSSPDLRRKRATVTLVGLFIALVLLLASWSWLANSTNAGSRGVFMPTPAPRPEQTVMTKSSVATAAPARNRPTADCPTFAQRAPRLKSTTSTVCSRIIRSNTSPWFLT